MKATASKKLEKKAKPLTKKQLEIKAIQDEVAERVSKAMQYGNPYNTSKWIKEAMIKHGYSESSARCLKVTQTKTWNELMEAIPDDLVVAKLIEHIQCEDKRVSMDAIKETNKLKNRYPAQKIKIGTFKDELSEVADIEYED